MYDIIKFVLTCGVALIGLILFLMPEKSVKAEDRDKPEEIAKIKRNGLVIMILGILLTVIFFIL